MKLPLIKMSTPPKRKLLPAPAKLSEHNEEADAASESGVLEKPLVQEPSFYRVILLNDDFTPMDFVTHVLQKFFHKSNEEAQEIMNAVHKEGQGIAGVFPFEVAETKVFMTNNYSKQNKYPLKCKMEKE